MEQYVTIKQTFVHDYLNGKLWSSM